jgi:hypothetical protein
MRMGDVAFPVAFCIWLSSSRIRERSVRRPRAGQLGIGGEGWRPGGAGGRVTANLDQRPLACGGGLGCTSVSRASSIDGVSGLMALWRKPVIDERAEGLVRGWA